MTISNTPEFLTFCLILMRMAGFIFFNPILGKKGIPNSFKSGLAVVLTIVIYQIVEPQPVEVISSLSYGILMIKELLVGFIIGFLMNLFEFVAVYAATIIDYQMGLSMASVYDPTTGAQVALTGNLFKTYFWLLFFAVDGHLALFKILIEAGAIIPYGSLVMGKEVSIAILQIFIECVVLAVKLAIPIIIFEFLVEIGMGILMRMIPQINLFVLSIQLRIVIGLIMLMVMSTVIGDYLNDVIIQMIQEIQDVLYLMG